MRLRFDYLEVYSCVLGQVKWHVSPSRYTFDRTESAMRLVRVSVTEENIKPRCLVLSVLGLVTAWLLIW